jgi:hypothetical protein
MRSDVLKVVLSAETAFRSSRKSALSIDALDVNRRAIAPAGERAILILAHVGDLDRQPDAHAREQHREQQCRKVDQHAVPVIVLVSSALVLCEAFDGRRRMLRCPLRPAPAAGAIGRGAPGPERHDAVVVIVGSVGCHAG